MHYFIQTEIQKLVSLLRDIQQDKNLLQIVDDIAKCCVKALQQGNKIVFAGNGGSAADSQHLAAELVVRLCYDRPGIAAIALTTDTSILTAIGNDTCFENIFSRQIETIGRPGDIFIGISTSGKSPNILRAFDAAHHQQMTTIAFTGKTTPLLVERCDMILNVPCTETPKIQECHIMFGHIICGLIENAIYGVEYDQCKQTV